MRVSEFFSIDMKQPSLDFVDVDVHNDVKLFVDPRAFLAFHSDWGTECIALIRDFFSVLLQAVHRNKKRTGLYLLKALHEPNETKLGLSRKGSRGRAVGEKRAIAIWDSLRGSEAVHRGIVNDLEDASLMVPNIRSDIISDITTNIVREPLIEYTQAVCQLYGIPLQQDIPSGLLWNPKTNSWSSNFVHLPIVDDKKIILVPKAIIRYQPTYNPEEYYRHYLLEDMAQDELSRNSALVELLKNGRRRVTKKALIRKYGTGKSILVEQTLKYPGSLRRYRFDKRLPNPPLSHLELSRSPLDIPDWDAILNNVLTIKAGRKEADRYEKAVEKLLYALFYPALANPISQHPIHNGRKRIDITFTNIASEGFFYWLSTNYRAPHIFVECKNYNGEVGNPELDQLSGRFSSSRGQCGILLCRSFNNKRRFLQRCRDTAMDQRGYIIPLDDSDLTNLVEQAKEPGNNIKFQLLKDKFDGLIM